MDSNKLFDLLDPQAGKTDSSVDKNYFIKSSNANHNDNSSSNLAKEDKNISIYPSNLAKSIQALQMKFYPSLSLQAIDDAIISSRGDLNSAYYNLAKTSSSAAHRTLSPKESTSHSSRRKADSSSGTTQTTAANFFKLSWINKGKAGAQLEEDVNASVTSTPRVTNSAAFTAKVTSPKGITHGDKTPGNTVSSKTKPQKSGTDGAKNANQPSSYSIGKLVSRKISDTFGFYSQFKNPFEAGTDDYPVAPSSPVLPVLHVNATPPSATFIESPTKLPAGNVILDEEEGEQNILSIPWEVEDNTVVESNDSEAVPKQQKNEGIGTVWSSFID